MHAILHLLLLLLLLDRVGLRSDYRDLDLLGLLTRNPGINHPIAVIVDRIDLAIASGIISYCICDAVTRCVDHNWHRLLWPLRES